MKMGKRIERFIAIVLSTIIVISNLMLISNDVSAASVITNANSVSGSNYTSDATLASNLDAIFKGTVNIFKTASNGHLSLPLGTVTSGDDVYTISGSGTYKSCHAYACAVYYKLFGDLLSGGNTSACKNSTAVCVGASSISYSLLSSNGVKCGSMIRTTPNSNGTYNGNSGHTMIILSYNSSGITFLENQIPSGSNYRVQIKTQTWSEFNSFALTNNSHGTRYVSFILVPKNGSTLVVPNPGAFSLNDPGLISQGNYTLSWGASSNATNYDLRIKAPNDSNYVSVYSGTSRSYTYNFSQYGVYHAIVIATNSSGNANTSIVAIKVYSLEWQNSSYDSTIGRYAVDVSYIDLDLITYGTSVYYEIYRNGTMLYKSNYSSDYRAQGIYDANHGTPTYVNGNLISGDYSVTFYSEAGRIYGEIIHVYNTYQETVDNPIQVRLEDVPYVPGNARMVELIITNTSNVSQTVSGVRYGSRLQAVSGLEPGDTVYRYSLVPNDSYVYINGFGSFGRTVNDTEGPSYSNYSVTWIDDNTILVGVDVSDPSGIYIYEFGSVAALKRDGSYVSSDEVQYIYGLDIGDNPSEHYVKNYTPFDRIVYMGTNYGTSCGDVSRMNVTNLTDTSAHFSFTMDLSELDRTQSESDYQIVIFSTDAYSNRNSELFEIDLSRCFVSPTPTATNTPVPTLTDTPVPTVTDIPAPTATDAPVPTVTDVPAPTATPTVTSEPTVVPTATDTPTVIPTTTSEPTPTEEVSPTPEGPTMAPPTPTDAPDDTRVADFVERLYTVALDRPSEEGGKQYWISELLRGTSGATAARGFFLGSELTGKNISDVEFVTRLYRTFMDREPDDIGLSYWVAKLGNGATREEVFKGFINSSEWIRICEDCGINPGSDGYGAEKLRTAFVTRLYTTCLGRESDATGVAYWSGKLAQGNITGTQLAHDFFFSPEFVDGNYSNVEFIRRMYRTFMGREADDTGLSYWITKMSNGATREQVFMGFAQSSEFAGICQQAGIQV